MILIICVYPMRYYYTQSRLIQKNLIYLTGLIRVNLWLKPKYTQALKFEGMFKLMLS